MGRDGFVTDVDTHKVDELVQEPNVNVSYYRDRTREWVSVSGTARVSQDRKRIHELYRPDWRAWFAKEDDVRDGGPVQRGRSTNRPSPMLDTITKPLSKNG